MIRSKGSSNIGAKDRKKGHEDEGHVYDLGEGVFHDKGLYVWVIGHLRGERDGHGAAQ